MKNKDLNRSIRAIEKNWLKILYDGCVLQFSNVHIPSHDAEHHRRVWGYAKELLTLLNSNGMAISETEIEQTMVSVFFHDQGMSQTFSKEHGKISSRLCSAYFLENHLPPPQNFDLVKASIEMHDQKNYQPARNTPNAFNLQQVLNIADDLDAFSIIGAYRYIEIYLLRHFNTIDLPQAVIDNLNQRYNHFASLFNTNLSYLKKHEARYVITRQYFTDLVSQLNNKEYATETYIGPMGVVNFISDKILGQQWSVPTTCSFIETSVKDDYIKNFFRTLSKEYAASTDVKI
jgi:hypothetical protein